MQQESKQKCKEDEYVTPLACFWFKKNLPDIEANINDTTSIELIDATFAHQRYKNRLRTVETLVMLDENNKFEQKLAPFEKLLDCKQHFHRVVIAGIEVKEIICSPTPRMGTLRVIDNATDRNWTDRQYWDTEGKVHHGACILRQEQYNDKMSFLYVGDPDAFKVQYLERSRQRQLILTSQRNNNNLEIVQLDPDSLLPNLESVYCKYNSGKIPAGASNETITKLMLDDRDFFPVENECLSKTTQLRVSYTNLPGFDGPGDAKKPIIVKLMLYLVIL